MASSAEVALGEVPVLDLVEMDPDAAAACMDAALRRFGFYYVRNHGIPEALLAQQFQVAAKIFELPAATKEAMPFDPWLDIGYQSAGSQQLDAKGAVPVHGDTKEAFLMTNNALLLDALHVPVADDPFRGAKLFRPPVPEHAEVTRAYVAAAGALNKQLNALLFRALQLQPAECEALGSKPFMVLKQMRYAGDPSDPENGKFGAGAHADWGAFTLLATDATPGLQIQMGGEWLPVPPLPGCLIINSGDQIAQMTNDAYRSAVHRVVTTSSKPRFSTAVFTYFNLDAEVGPLPRLVTLATPARHPSGRTTKQYFHFKLQESMERGGSYAPTPDA